MIYLIEKADNSLAETVTTLLNTVTLELMAKQINQWKYPWNLKEIEQDIENGRLYVLKENDIVIATFSINDLFMNPWIPIGESNYLYRIAILPEFQGKNIGVQIISYAFQISDSLKRPLYLDCWAGNNKLKRIYLKAGFTYLGDFPEDDYQISVFKHQ